MSRNLLDLQIEWLEANNLSNKIYYATIQSIDEDQDVFLERSVKIDTKTLDVISNQRYVVGVTQPTVKSTKTAIEKCLQLYQINSENFFKVFNQKYVPTERHHFYVGIDGLQFKSGMDYINNCLVGVAAVGDQIYSRKYELFKNHTWFDQLDAYVKLYKNNLHPLVFESFTSAMSNCRASEEQDVYIKRDQHGLVWHMDSKRFSIPDFEFLLTKHSSNFKEKFTWISINDQLDKMTLYMRPIF